MKNGRKILMNVLGCILCWAVIFGIVYSYRYAYVIDENQKKETRELFIRLNEAENLIRNKDAEIEMLNRKIDSIGKSAKRYYIKIDTLQNDVDGLYVAINKIGEIEYD